MRPGTLEVIIVLVIVLLLFGPGRIGKVAGEIGTSIRNFRKGMQGDDEEKEKKVDDETANPPKKVE